MNEIVQPCLDVDCTMYECPFMYEYVFGLFVLVKC